MPTDPGRDRGGRPLLALVLFLLATFAGGALLAPWLYRAAQAAAPLHPMLANVAEMPFARFVNRALMLAALVGLPFYLRGAGIRRWSDVGLERGRIEWRRFGAGFALGFASLAAVCAVTLAFGGRTLNLSRSAGEIAGQLVAAVLAAVLVGVIEELIFRGAIFGGLRRSMPWGAALVASSVVYGLVHFMERPVSPQTVDWSAGLRALPTMLAGMTELHRLVPALASLTLAGVILGLAYLRTGDLWVSIGIHGGWIFWLKFYGFLTKATPGADQWLWGTRKLIDGWLAFIAIVVVLAVVLAAGRGGWRRGPAAVEA